VQIFNSDGTPLRSCFEASEFGEKWKQLLDNARAATGKSYAPYSRFLVGAAICLEDGTVVTGGNQENASYPLCMCAERVALYASASVYPGRKIAALAVVAHRYGTSDLVPATPCGACRQVMVEFEQNQQQPISVLLFGPGNKYYLLPSSAALLPMAFDRNSL